MAGDQTELLARHQATEFKRDWAQATIYAQQNALAELVDKVNQQACMVSEVQVEQSRQSSIPQIMSSIVTPTVQGGLNKNTKPPDLPPFLRKQLTPKEEATFKAWIFQVRFCCKTYTDDAILQAIINNVRGTMSIVVRAGGYEAELDNITGRLVKQFGMGQTDDDLLQDFHQLSQGP